jgi:hypothetical protein
LEALEFYQLFYAVGDVHIPILVFVADITRFEEAIGCDRGGSRGGIIVVASEDIGASYPELAFFAGGDFVAVGRHEFYDLIWEGGAVGADAVVPLFLCNVSSVCRR